MPGLVASTSHLYSSSMSWRHMLVSTHLSLAEVPRVLADHMVTRYNSLGVDFLIWCEAVVSGHVFHMDTLLFQNSLLKSLSFPTALWMAVFPDFRASHNLVKYFLCPIRSLFSFRTPVQYMLCLLTVSSRSGAWGANRPEHLSPQTKLVCKAVYGFIYSGLPLPSPWGGSPLGSQLKVGVVCWVFPFGGT